MKLGINFFVKKSLEILNSMKQFTTDFSGFLDSNFLQKYQFAGVSIFLNFTFS